MADVRTRFAPSPTGDMHIGNLRTAFYAYALAKHVNGKFILRIEDTDKKREVEGGVDEIKSLLKKFTIEWDELYIQSERLPLYKEAAEKLVAEGHAFYCQCEGKNAKKEGFSTVLRDECRDKGLKSGAIKLLVPDNEQVKFTDFVLGNEVRWETNIVFDATLLKSDGFPTYHLAVVVDDHAMGISHVLRGHDWLPSTPIHLLVYKFLGFEVPLIGHLTDILDPEGGKLSKRKGSTSVKGLLAEGYLPQALFNFVILSGWAPKNNQEIYSLESFVKDFDLKGLQKSNPVFNKEKLDWFNNQYIQKLSDEEFFKAARPFVSKEISDELLHKIVPLVKTRVKKLSELGEYLEYFYKHKDPIFDLTDKYNAHVSSALEALEKVNDWNLEAVNSQLTNLIGNNNFKTGDFYMDLRATIAGSRNTPPINESIEILGREETLGRLKNALAIYNKRE